MFTVCFVYSFCDEGWKGSENKIFYIYIYIYILDGEFLFYTFERGINKFPRDL